MITICVLHCYSISTFPYKSLPKIFNNTSFIHNRFLWRTFIFYFKEIKKSISKDNMYFLSIALSMQKFFFGWKVSLTVTLKTLAKRWENINELILCQCLPMFSNPRFTDDQQKNGNENTQQKIFEQCYFNSISDFFNINWYTIPA